MRHISPKIWLILLQKIKDQLKSDDTIQEICKKYNLTSDILDIVPIKFGDIGVSARTDHGIITLNWNLLKQENRSQIPSYICHEFNHFARQLHQPTQSADDGDYLSNKDEQEAFQYQLKFIDDHFGEDKAEEYVDQVLDHHDETGTERKEKKDILMEKVED